MDLLDSVSTFPCLGHTIVFNKSDCEALYLNLRKVQRRWGLVSGVLVKAGETVQVREMFYKAVVQAFLIYRSENWVIMDSIMNVL